MKKLLLLTLLMLPAFALAQPQSDGEPDTVIVSKPEAMTFYTPPGFSALFGMPQPGAGQRLVLCSFSASRIRARAEWFGRLDGASQQFELDLEPGECGTHELTADTQPDYRGIVTSWRVYDWRLGPRQEVR